jgi:hypothetical protein
VKNTNNGGELLVKNTNNGEKIYHMCVNKICILACFGIFSFAKVYGIEGTDSLFKVLKIKVTGDYYVIYAQRNDSLFKIISKKVPLNNTQNLQLLKTGLRYYFDFGSRGNGTKDKLESLAGIINNSDVKNNHVFVDGHTRIKFTRRWHYRLYTTKNLIGLYYSGPTGASR